MANINNHNEACQTLGIENNSGRETWKSAYRTKCQMYHPDVLPENDPDREINIENYMLVKEAYEYLEKEYETALKLKNIKPKVKQPAPAVKAPKVMGSSPMPGDGTTQEKRRARKKADEKAKENKEQRYKELLEKGKKIRQEEKEKWILDEIRWLRVAEIIRNTMAEDAKRKSAEENLAEMIKSKQ